MLVAELIAGFLCEGDEGARDSEDLVVVIGMIGQQLRPADDRFCIAGAPCPLKCSRRSASVNVPSRTAVCVFSGSKS